MADHTIYATFTSIIVLLTCNCNQKPNFVFILTDDLDDQMDGLKPMKNTRQLIGLEGITFENAFTTSPLCCPSRASILTGLHMKNHRVVNNSKEGGCYSEEWICGLEKLTFIKQLNDNDYVTFFGGKYLNQYGKSLSAVPKGWDWWVSLKGNSKYYNYQLNINGTWKSFGSDPETDYFTSVIENYAINFLRYLMHEPFFMMVSTSAPHSPSTPERKYKYHFRNQTTPRTPNFNKKTNKDKHWLIRQYPQPLSNQYIEKVDSMFRNRWRTLLSVDDLIAKIHDKLRVKKLLHKTYFVFTSDNGFHLGQFSLPYGKRQPYEFDIKVPLLIKGPGVPVNTVEKRPVLLLDLAPTFLHLAGLPIPAWMDGASLHQLFFASEKLNNVNWRKFFFIEYRGEGTTSNGGKCIKDETWDCNFQFDCKCEDSKNNTYICIREISVKKNFLYCQFFDEEMFEEVYNLKNDPYEIQNLAQRNYCRYKNFNKKDINF